MNKKYRLTPKENWYIIFLFSSIPLVRLLMERTVSTSLWVQILVYLLVSLSIIFSRSQTLAEIKNNVLYLYTGSGLYDPDHIELSRIYGTQRITNRLLTIQYDNRALSIEAYKRVLDQLEKDLNTMKRQ